jgi:transcription initiation factor IIF auxiliary subunit
VYKPPYEFQEVGWGEFEIQIQIHFNHPDMPYVELPHMLRVRTVIVSCITRTPQVHSKVKNLYVPNATIR